MSKHIWLLARNICPTHTDSEWEAATVNCCFAHCHPHMHHDARCATVVLAQCRSSLLTRKRLQTEVAAAMSSQNNCMQNCSKS